MLSLGKRQAAGTRRTRRAPGDSTLDTTTLFAANMIILWVMALALAGAGKGHRDAPYWRSWVLANIVLGAALAVFTFDWQLPPLLAATLPNGLLVLGLGLRWRAAREFSDRPAPAWLVWAPLLVFLVVASPWAHVSYAPAFTVANVVLAFLSAATAYEFWRDRDDGLPSRYALVIAHAVMAASFAWRIGLGVLGAEAMPYHLPQDTALAIHLTIAVFHTVASSAFALSLAYERTNKELRHATSHDALTGLLNRGAFETELESALRQADSRPFALALFDIDHFKQVNDSYGHAAGDEALRSCARICREQAGRCGVAARVGGEEFAVILYEVGHDEAHAAIERTRRVIAAASVTAGSRRIHITVSGGVCHSSTAPGDLDALMRLADAGLYEAKNRGRNRIENMAA